MRIGQCLIYTTIGNTCWTVSSPTSYEFFETQQEAINFALRLFMNLNPETQRAYAYADCLSKGEACDHF